MFIWCSTCLLFSVHVLALIISHHQAHITTLVTTTLTYKVLLLLLLLLLLLNLLLSQPYNVYRFLAD